MTAIATPIPRPRDARWTYALWLTVSVAVALLLTLPFSLQVAGIRAGYQRPGTPLLASGLLLQTTIMYVVIRLGLSLGASIDLGWPPLAGWQGDRKSVGPALRTLGGAALLGAATVPLVMGLVMLLRQSAQAPPHMVLTPWMMTMASVGAGIQEEILFRLGVMTVVAWLLSRIQSATIPRTAIVWSANVVAAILFGAAHLPIARAVGALTPSTITFVFAANGFVGLLFGWLYWRKGLIAAMTAHASVDLVLKVLLPALSSMALTRS